MPLRSASVLSLVVCILLLALVPAQAAADNTTLRAAGKSRDSQFEALGKKTRRAASAWRRSGFTRPRARRVLSVLRATLAEITVVSRAVQREAPSTAGGATYKRLFFKSMQSFRHALRLDGLGVRSRTAGKRKRANGYFDRAGRAHRLTARYEHQGIRAIESGG